jgi:hypothetical protein
LPSCNLSGIPHWISTYHAQEKIHFFPSRNSALT